MKRAVLALIVSLFLLPLTAFGVEITSIYPAVAFVGTPVTIIGGPFTSKVMVELGNQQIHPDLINPRQLIFITPQLPVGEYSLFLRDAGQASQQTYSLRIEFPPPSITSLTPASLDECATPEQQRVSLHGENIQKGAQLLLNGAVIPAAREEDLSYSFTPPTLPAGSYGVQLVNPDGKRSLPYTLEFNGRPEIESISEGENFVNYYQVIIRGKNFSHNSVLLVKEYPGGFSDYPPRQRFIPVQGRRTSPNGGTSREQAENVIYQDCHSLIYNRYPAFNQAMRIVFQVGNPDGRQTAPYETSLP
ncbi:IPT/TIG domain-containing protein [Geopsychrobacter electrodiphilus]|uniref:IPT/TIG domain-containing protein n=1 Tax=Geopsychrobacter electrodiphilus TaxID=225196 RepID=UPI0003620728|nr:IPT/TIG domain-containing protein [Geopsychrobacter electrodiphilus]